MEQRVGDDIRAAWGKADSLSQAVINSLRERIVVVDPAGKVIATNRACDRFRAEHAGELELLAPGADYLSTCPPEVARGIRDVLAGSLAEFVTEYPLDLKTGRIWFLLAATRLETGSGVVISHLDITSRHKAEETYRRRAVELAMLAKSLKKTNEELDQFAYITSHDLRAPLRGIANLSTWIEEDMGEKFTPEAHQQMDVLRGRVHRMEAMIDGILEYSRVGRVRTPPKEIDVASLLAETIDLLAPPADVVIEVAPGMPVIVGDPLRLQQVFMNLIGNAIKYNDKPAGVVRIEWRDADEFVEFSVADNGPGIEPQYHEKIFVIFQTLQPRDKVEATGVGLSLVRKIVENSGGTVSVESDVGRGSTFRFTWPRRVASDPPTDKNSPEAQTPEGPQRWKTAG